MKKQRHHATRIPKRKRARALRIEQVAFGPEVGPGVVTATLEELDRALRSQPSDLGWDEVSGDVIPVMPRIRPYPPGFPEPLRVVVEPGVAIGFAIDIGPAFMNISADLIRSWGVPVSDVHARSLVNLSDRAGRIKADAIVDGSLDGTPTRWLQTGHSIGSVMVLVPDTLRQVFGSEPAFFITPMRDLIIGLPPDIDRQLAAWLWLEIAAEDPNCLGPVGYAFNGRFVVTESLDVPLVLDPHGSSLPAQLA